jgi:hypothetical protein
MRKSVKIWMLILISCAVPVKAQETRPLKLIATTPMSGFTGIFDHFGLDLEGNRLFLASEDQGTVEVLDLRTGERVHSVKGFTQPLTMAFLAESNRLLSPTEAMLARSNSRIRVPWLANQRGSRTTMVRF